MKNQKIKLTRVNKTKWLTTDKRFGVLKDIHGYYFPIRLYYPLGTNDNFYTSAVDISYDYSRNYRDAVQVLQMVLDGTWKRGKGRYLNGLNSK